MAWQPATPARTNATIESATAHRNWRRLEGISDSCAEELARSFVLDDRRAGEEDSVAQRESDVTGDLPVEKEIGLETEVRFVQSLLVDRRIAGKFIVDEEIDA